MTLAEAQQVARHGRSAKRALRCSDSRAASAQQRRPKVIRLRKGRQAITALHGVFGALSFVQPAGWVDEGGRAAGSPAPPCALASPLPALPCMHATGVVRETSVFKTSLEW